MSGVPEGASENEGSGRWMRSERKVVVCADGGAAGDGGWLMVVVVEANEQAGGQAGWMTREGREGGEELGGGKGPEEGGSGRD